MLISKDKVKSNVEKDEGNFFEGSTNLDQPLENFSGKMLKAITQIKEYYKKALELRGISTAQILIQKQSETIEEYAINLAFDILRNSSQALEPATCHYLLKLNDHMARLLREKPAKYLKHFIYQ